MITPRTDPLLWLSLMITMALAALAARYRYTGRHDVIRPRPPATHSGRPCLVDVVAWHWRKDPR